MENKKVLLSNIQKKEKYKAIIEVENENGLEYIYIENPYGKKFSELFEKIQNYLSYEDAEFSAIQIYNWMFENLTNIELDEELKNLDELDEIPTLFEALFYLKQIFDTVENAVWMNLTSLYTDSKNEKYKKMFLEEFENSIKDREEEIEEDNED